MNKQKLSQLLDLIFLPVLLGILGLVLLIAPDAASALTGKIFGWFMILAGVCSAIDTLLRWPRSGITKIVITILAFLLGGYVLSNPLVLSMNMGRLAGIILVIQGINSLMSQRKISAIVTLTAAVILLFAPMTASRLVFRLLGLVLIVIGAVNLIARLRAAQLLEEPEDPNIIDADP